ncbi:hypothetical protein [Thermosyntropha sp.]|uniref:hypothetical protein n=1 Tax=Thermosyntropha sp. TaxID=2740820 RepID=UPI0025D6BE2A|nr:hypothetical protein [Thermosyntropha sp.]MBO8159069.1 hypothetical protein [Thermosyntropha sp.]
MNEIISILGRIIPERREDIMTIAEQLKREGKMEGIKESFSCFFIFLKKSRKPSHDSWGKIKTAEGKG